MTAVEWLFIKLDNTLELYPSEWDKLSNAVEQAKAMEKEQIIDANIAGMKFIAVDPTLYQQDAEQYYKETYES